MGFKKAYRIWKDGGYDFESAFYYLQGNIRNYFYWKKYGKYLIPRFIREQIFWRYSKMKRECWDNSFCKTCGCDVPELQCCAKGCPSCYPRMKSKLEWYIYKTVKEIII